MGANYAFHPSQWQELFTTSCFQIYFADNDPICLGSEWSTDELDHQCNKEHTDYLNPGHLQQREPTPFSSGPPSLVVSIPSVPLSSELPVPSPIPSPAVPLIPSSLVPPHSQEPPILLGLSVPDESSEPSKSPNRQSTHICHPLQCFGFDDFQDTGSQAFASFAATFVNCSEKNQQYHTFLSSDLDTESFDFHDPILYQATTKKKDPDLPTYYEALTGRDCEAFYQAMGNEICELDNKNTWTLVKQSKMKARHYRDLPSTSAFHHKCFPDGFVQELKSHLCVCGDQQTYGVDYFDYFESYAPVIQWTTV